MKCMLFLEKNEYVPLQRGWHVSSMEGEVGNLRRPLDIEISPGQRTSRATGATGAAAMTMAMRCAVSQTSIKR